MVRFDLNSSDLTNRGYYLHFSGPHMLYTQKTMEQKNMTANMNPHRYHY